MSDGQAGELTKEGFESAVEVLYGFDRDRDDARLTLSLVIGELFPSLYNKLFPDFVNAPRESPAFERALPDL